MEPYQIGCQGMKFISPICGFAVWGSIAGEILRQTDLIQYLVDNYQPLNTWLSDITDIQLSGDAEPGDIFYVNNALEIERLPIGDEPGYVLSPSSGLPSWQSIRDLLGYAYLDDLADVDLDILQTGDLLYYNGTMWVNVTFQELIDGLPPGTLGGNIYLDDLADVDASSPSDGEVLTYSSGAGGFIMAPVGGGGGASISSDNVDNDSGVDGGAGSVSDALDSLQSQIDGLGGGGGGGSDSITNESGVSGTTVSDALDALNAAIGSGYRGAVATGGTVSSPPGLVSWGSPSIDTDSIWSAGNPTRLTVPSGVTKIRLFYYLYLGSNGTISGHIRKNGSGTALSGTAGANDQTVGGITPLNHATCVLSVTGGDYFTLYSEVNPLQSFFEMQILQ